MLLLLGSKYERLINTSLQIFVIVPMIFLYNDGILAD